MEPLGILPLESRAKKRFPEIMPGRHFAAIRRTSWGRRFLSEFDNNQYAGPQHPLRQFHSVV
jgi:hypothetical protein